MNFLFQSPADEYSPDRLGRIKVLLVGNTGCGKTCLAHLLCNGEPLVSATHPTIGCNVSLLVMTYPPDRAKANPALAGQDFFLELWDVGAHPRYEAMRSLFYHGVNGVVLVHDLSFSRSLASLQRWAAEVAHLGTFAAPYSEDRASLNLGGLPVPCLVVGNKQDLVPKFRAKYVRGWREQLWSTLNRPLGRFKCWVEGALARPGGSGNEPAELGRRASSGGLPKESLLHGNLQASVARGDLDMHAVNSFFCTLIERRYCPSCPSLIDPQPLPVGLSLPGPALAASGPATPDPGEDEVARAAAAHTAAYAAIAAHQRLSAERLPPVMYNAISEESSPYSSISGTPFGRSPYASAGNLYRGSSGNLSSWAPGAVAPGGAGGGGGLQRQHSGGPQQFPGVSVALKLQAAGGNAGPGGEAGGKGAAGAPPARAPLFGGGGRSPLFGGW